MYPEEDNCKTFEITENKGRYLKEYCYQISNFESGQRMAYIIFPENFPLDIK